MNVKVIGSEADAIEEALQEAGAADGERSADDRADRNQPHGLSHDAPALSRLGFEMVAGDEFESDEA